MLASHPRDVLPVAYQPEQTARESQKISFGFFFFLCVFMTFIFHLCVWNFFAICIYIYYKIENE